MFLSAAPNPPDLWSDVPLGTLDNWPMDGLVTGHRHEAILARGSKAVWMKYSECQHCPGIHPELCDQVPVYGKSIVSVTDALGWRPDAPVGQVLKPGAEICTMTGLSCRPALRGWRPWSGTGGYSFVMLWPSACVVAHGITSAWCGCNSCRPHRQG